MVALAYEEYYTIDDYKKWEGDWELIYGKPYAMAPFALPAHQVVSSNILFELKKQLENCEECEAIMESEVIFSKDTILRPDVIVYCDEIKEKLTKTPPLIFEVVSPATIKRDEIIKKEIYEKEGVKYYTIIYPDEKRVKIYENKDGKFVKVGDDEKFKYEFDCTIEMDFSKIWLKERNVSSKRRVN